MDVRKEEVILTPPPRPSLPLFFFTSMEVHPASRFPPFFFFSSQRSPLDKAGRRIKEGAKMVVPFLSFPSLSSFYGL